MKREEAIKQIRNRVSMERDYKQFYAIVEALERLEQPLTIAEFLGWEEGIEYIRAGNIFKVEGNNLFKKGEECSSGWCNFYMLSDELINLRNATKYVPKYYAKIKGWELIPSDYYYFGLDDLHNLEIKDECDAYEFTKTEWAELGINDSNADFEDVEE